MADTSKLHYETKQQKCIGASFTKVPLRRVNNKVIQFESEVWRILTNKDHILQGVGECAKFDAIRNPTPLSQ